VLSALDRQRWLSVAPCRARTLTQSWLQTSAQGALPDALALHSLV
jgi:hypothetical protein